MAAIAGGAGLEVVIGPAGTGKTAMLAAAQAALRAQGRELVVLAPTRKAAQVATEELGPRPRRWPSCSTTTAGAGTTSGVIARPVAPSSVVLPASRSPHGLSSGGRGYGRGPPLSAGSVVVVDEAGLLSVDQAVALIDVVRESGASLRLVGDPRQLGAVGRGGVMETAARWAPGGEVTLGQVHRFLALEAGPDGLPQTVPDQGWAQLCEQLREGTEPVGAAEALLERGAVVVHPSREEVVAAMAAEAAREAGREGALAVTVATNADARELNQAVRALRVAAGEVDDSVVATGMDGARIGAGDRVVTRRNDNTLAVANREPWTVSAVNGDGSLVVRGKERHVQLPAEYVVAAVQLGYAATDYGNQGVTAARSATWVSPATSAGGLYVGASRGRLENSVHVVARPRRSQGHPGRAVRRDRADRGLETAGPGPRRRPSGLPRTPEAPPRRCTGGVAQRRPSCEAALRRVGPRLARELARAAPVPVMDEATWRAETEADRAVARKGARSTAAWHEAQAAQAKAGRGELLEAAQAEFSQAREDARVIAAGPGRFGRRAERVREAQERRAETAERWRGYITQLPGEHWPDETVAQVATSAADARLAHQLRFCEAEIDKAANAAQLAEERMAQRDARREKALAHNEVAAARALELEASAEAARAKLVEERRAMTAGMAPEEVRAIDTARDAELERGRVLKSVLQERRV